MDKQKTFNKVAKHLLTQGVKSEKFIVPGAPTCVYRGNDGLKCAIGCLIPNTLYKKSFEEKGCYELFASRVSLDLRKHLKYKEGDDAFLAGLQRVHDDTEVSEWQEELSYFAKQWKLNDSILEKFADENPPS